MDPISIIVAALVSGAAAAAKDTASQAVSDAYSGLKTAFVHCWEKATQDEAKAQFLIEGLEKNPDAIESYVRAEMTSQLPEPEENLIALAQQLQALLESEGGAAPKYNVNVDNSQGVAVGDGAVINMNITSDKS